MSKALLTPAAIAAALSAAFGKGTLTQKVTAQKVTTRIHSAEGRVAAPKPRSYKEELATIPFTTASIFRRQRCTCCGKEPWALEGEYIAYRDARHTQTRLSRETSPAIASGLPHEVIWHHEAREITMCAECATLSSSVADLLVDLDLNSAAPAIQLELFL